MVDKPREITEGGSILGATTSLQTGRRARVASGGREELRRFVGRRGIEIAAVAVIYFGVARFGLLFAFTTKQVTAVWPPTVMTPNSTTMPRASLRNTAWTIARRGTRAASSA